MAHESTAIADPDELSDAASDRRLAGTAPGARGSRWTHRRRALFAALALVGVLAIAALAHALAGTPRIAAHWRVDASGRIELAGSSDVRLQPHVGQTITAIAAGAGPPQRLDGLALQRTPRWVVADADRERQQVMQAAVAAALESDSLRLYFASGTTVELRPVPHGWAALPAAFWVLTATALGLLMMALAPVLARPSTRNLVYAWMVVAQVGNLALTAAQLAFEFGLPPPWGRWALPLHVGLDLATGAAMITVVCLHPRRLPGAGWFMLGAWGATLAVVAACAANLLPLVWWVTQFTVIAMGVCAIGLLSWSYRIEPHPFAIVLRQFGLVTGATWALLTLALAASEGMRTMPHNIADTAAMIWYVYLASFLLLVPFLAKSQTVLREFALLAAISTVAISLYLLFVAVFGFGQLSSLTLSLFVSLGVYSAGRQWIMGPLLGSSALTTERMFEQVYRIAREVETRPERTPALLTELLGELFEPLQIEPGNALTQRARVVRDGSSLLVPLPAFGALAPNAPRSVLVRFAQRGRRLFTVEDARLTDRVVEQLRRAVQFDQAVEQGRREERARLAQDLHDDIGARLLTLMYKAQSPEMEDYVRHTLQDLKTLTRGLAAASHRLSHAAAEWKADLSHRLTAAHVELRWTLEFDDDVLLSVVHWSALTRILRELVSNAIAHSQAQRLDIELRLAKDRLEMTISDDGVGRQPRDWSHGLGLGGIRKRVKQLGGTVEWRELQPRGISCRVVIRDLSEHV